MPSQQLEALERAVHEIEALEAIYGGHDIDNDDGGRHNSAQCITSRATEGFEVHSKTELQKARSAVDAGGGGGGGGGGVPDLPGSAPIDAPLLDVEVRISVRLDLGGGSSAAGVGCPPDDDARNGNNRSKNPGNSDMTVSLRCRLPPGYPDRPVLVSASAGGLLRGAAREELSSRLAGRAEELAGSEAVMELAEAAREWAAELYAAQWRREAAARAEPARTTAKSHSSSSGSGRRCWIWVHHIKDSSRRRSIVREARDRNLGGYLKAGYPGVVVIEGDDAVACEEFVTWIKGNKSRPGGFGRNWGHHVRGEVDVPSGARQLPAIFQELEESMGVLGSLCKEHGLEAEFKEYVMQHKGSESRIGSKE